MSMNEKTGMDLLMEFQKEIKKGLTQRAVELFQCVVYRFYAIHKRSFPWRETRDPYRILVSEYMLRQTQVDRVIEKYNKFVTRFPSFFSLAEAPLREILETWKGLGYNRRALSLKKTAERE